MIIEKYWIAAADDNSDEAADAEEAWTRPAASRQRLAGRRPLHQPAAKISLTCGLIRRRAKTIASSGASKT